MLDRRIQAEVPHAATGFCSERRGTRELLEPLNRTKHPLAGALSLQNNFAGGVAVGKYVVNVLKGSICLVPTKRQVEREITHAYISYCARIVFNMLSKRPH